MLVDWHRDGSDFGVEVGNSRKCFGFVGFAGAPQRHSFWHPPRFHHPPTSHLPSEALRAVVPIALAPVGEQRLGDMVVPSPESNKKDE